MLIRFFVKNYLSFDEEVEFSMMPSKVRAHKSHISKPENKDLFKVLRGAVVYGGNASGKSNFIKSIKFARDCILNNFNLKEGDFFSLRPFKFRNNKESKFEFDIRTLNGCYNYGFVLSREKIIKEWLYLIFQKKEDKLLFERNDSQVEWGEILTTNNIFSDFLKARTFRPNQLLLNKLIDDDIRSKDGLGNHFVNVYDWFKHVTFIYPCAKFNSMPSAIQALKPYMKSMLKAIGTKIDDLNLKPINVKDTINIDKLNFIKENQDFAVGTTNGNNDRIYVTRKNGEIEGTELTFMKKGIEFSTKEESDGTMRMVDIIPLFYLSQKQEYSNSVFFIDEIDKIAGKEFSSGPDVSREGVQRDILPIIEGSTVMTKYGPVKTDHMLFIAAGAFHVSKVSDLIPEIQGRFPIRVELESLTKDNFKQIEGS